MPMLGAAGESGLTNYARNSARPSVIHMRRTRSLGFRIRQRAEASARFAETVGSRLIISTASDSSGSKISMSFRYLSVALGL